MRLQIPATGGRQATFQVPEHPAPWIALAAAFVAASLELLRRLDKGRGVYISMSWFLPGLFIPTTV